MDNGDNTNSVGVTPSLIKQLKDEFGLRASKALGQNFLTDQNICANIVALVNDGESVVEVGPGVGSLTLAIANGGHKVHCVEFDEHILEPLKFVLDKFNVLSTIDQITSKNCLPPYFNYLDNFIKLYMG